jgi:succinyl-CoA synthetase alpha subunit
MRQVFGLPCDVPVVVQGMGRMGCAHARLMRAYGTNVVGGVSGAGRPQPRSDLPVFKSCHEAVSVTGAQASAVMVPAFEVEAAVIEAVDAGVRLVVTVTEGVPVHDAARILRRVRAAGAIWIGPTTPGLAVPSQLKLGFLPDVALMPGPVGVISKSGTLSYEVCYRLVRRGIGQSLWVGVGSDAVKGVSFSDLVPQFSNDPNTQALLVIGEIGGAEEEMLAGTLAAGGFSKPVVALIAGASAPNDVAMGHAGAIVHGEHGTFAAKERALRAAGATVCATIQDAVEAVVAAVSVSHPQRQAGSWDESPKHGRRQSLRSRGDDAWISGSPMSSGRSSRRRAGLPRTSSSRGR